jgi:phosphohistidine phosphatase
MKLYFLRHGLAGDQENWHGDDQSRPLTEQGMQAMHHEAETIAKLGLGLELVLTSPFVRAAQTAEIIVTR